MDPMGDISRCYAEACPRTFMPKPPKKTVIRNRFSSFCLEKKPWFKQLTNLRFSTSAYAITIGKTTNLTSVWGTLVVGRWYLGPHCTMDIGKRLVHVKSYGDVVAVTSFCKHEYRLCGQRSGTKLTSKSHLRMRVAGSMQFVQDWDRDETSHQFGCGLRVEMDRSFISL